MDELDYGGEEEDRFSTCSEVSSVQDLEDPSPNMLRTLLSEIYTQYQWSSGGLQTSSFDSNVYDDYVLQDNCLVKREPISHLTQEQLQEKSVEELQAILEDLKLRTKEKSSKLISFLRRRDQGKTRQKRGYALLTRLLQTIFKKTKKGCNSIPSRRLKFCMPAPTDPKQFNDWMNGLRAVAQLAPYGIDHLWRPDVWIACAEHNFREIEFEWSSVLKFAFNEKLNPDDHMLGVQIVKDLKRTGSCMLLSPDDDRAALKRVLLAYARWNKEVGYCQGFNIITSVLLKVLNNNEAAALKVMIQVVENLLPEHYFTNNLLALSVDLAVFRELLRVHLPRLWAHVTKLQGPVQKDAQTYEPPLTNVFTMQWFLTLFATCLPNEVALKVWDLIFLYGAEVLFRVALAIWSSLQNSVLNTHTCDEFYMLMSTATLDIRLGRQMSCEELMKKIHSIPPLSQEKLREFREEIMYNIQPPNLGLYTTDQSSVNCMSLLLNNNSKESRAHQSTKPDYLKPSLRETVKKREVDVTTRDIQNLLTDYRTKNRKQKLRTKQSIPTALHCVPDIHLARKLPEKSFSFDSSELSSRQIMLQQVSGFTSSQFTHSRNPSYPAGNVGITTDPTSRLFSIPPPTPPPTTASSTNPSNSFSCVTDALAHIRVSRIPDTQTEDFCNSGFSVQRPIPDKTPSGILAQTQSYNQEIGPLSKQAIPTDENDDSLTELFFEEETNSTEGNRTSELTAEQKRKQWGNKSKTNNSTVTSTTSPFSPYKTTQFSFDISCTQTNSQTNSHTNSAVTRQPADQYNNSVNNVTRVVHAGQTSDQYFNLRKNQAFLADMHSWSLTNATSLPLTVENRGRKHSK